jgi:hypothetical protein
MFWHPIILFRIIVNNPLIERKLEGFPLVTVKVDDWRIILPPLQGRTYVEAKPGHGSPFPAQNNEELDHKSARCRARPY